MCVARFFCTGLAGENFCERRLALHQFLQGGLDVVESFEVVHALGASAELARGLRTAQEEDAEDSGFGAGEVEYFLRAVLVLGDAAIGAAGGSGEAVLLESAQGVANGVFIELHDGVAIRFLIAGIDERVERERIVLGSGDVFFDEGAEGAGFVGGEDEFHGICGASGVDGIVSGLSVEK